MPSHSVAAEQNGSAFVGQPNNNAASVEFLAGIRKPPLLPWFVQSKDERDEHVAKPVGRARLQRTVSQVDDLSVIEFRLECNCPSRTEVISIRVAQDEQLDLASRRNDLVDLADRR